MDNLPVPLVPKLAELLRVPNSEINKIALGIDIRSGQKFPELECILEGFKESGMDYEILFLDASDDVLIKRYKETRRNHAGRRVGELDKGSTKRSVPM